VAREPGHGHAAVRDDDEAELLASIEDSADRLDHLIGGLLGTSRLQTGTVRPLTAPVDLDEVLSAALAAVPPGRVAVDIPADVPLVAADLDLLERRAANTVENAVTYNLYNLPGADRRGRRTRPGRAAGRRPRPGVPEDARDALFAPS
jgi:two-component system sensor histidine kinase KdpD